VTAVRLQTSPVRLSVTFGAPAELRADRGCKLALFGPNKVVAYLARHPPSRALYLFRTTPQPGTATHLRNVSQPVTLLYIAHTWRAFDKTTVALNVLKRRIGFAGIDALPDLFWYQLADFIERRGQQIVLHVTRLLERYATTF
jgi:hypothetical protein